MSFAEKFNQIDFGALLQLSQQATDRDVDQALASTTTDLERAAILLSPTAEKRLEELAIASRHLTWQRFGRIIQLYAPLYISNECVETCTYCGFSRPNQIKRLTLSNQQIVAEAKKLHTQGFRNLLLVSGEHPRLVSIEYINQIIQTLRPFIPSLSVEVAPQETEPYKKWVESGADGLVVYQETYDKKIYKQVHLAGKKRDFDWRLEAPERGGAAGFRRLGIGALLGLADWKKEGLSLVAHADYLLRHCWQSNLTLSLPRIKHAAGEFKPNTVVTDKNFVHLIAVLRLMLPDAGIVLSTREPQALRDKIIHLGATHMSAGSKTNPGGYSDDIEKSETQFDIEDTRSPQEIAAMLSHNGYDPVWKDWDKEFHHENHHSQ